MILRASYGTIQKVNGRLSLEMDTAYLMLGERCVYNCLYCAQSRSSTSPSHFLSRVTWKEVSEDLLGKLNDRFKRVCIQVVSYPGYGKDLSLIIPRFRIPVSVSVRAISVEEVTEYFELGADRVSIAVDVPNKDLFEKIRGGKYERHLHILEKSAEMFPGKITTHVIVGLGESDKDIVDFIVWARERNIVVSLFAFTPIRGTAFENRERPSLERYRKIQLVTYLLEKNLIKPENIIFDSNGKIIDVEWNGEFPEEALKTRGCPHCTRPYYNESPRGPIYNVHWR
ncbi:MULTISPECIES: radical SAM protein [unclassified Thermotoga]|uniref:radical SAM protein n=1 Tax=unclassified Thermotoga TaxID=2631113 RepID=UPI0005411A7D|nr:MULTISPECIES: radical SAM protein [unclassified Thermotoga]AIY88018.1 radical SAM domain-containing protein [Thermotoga sp. Cell2]KHC91095.1 radical SAM domain-containing protein [Thermotoga sp. TBGT1765]KHC92008.1 radical SAM domain-containing protein [Thermotoga sp. TBGT1766]KHC96698.1 radical SAM domain-containing protein [Thermotoga sp. Xyl54]